MKTELPKGKRIFLISLRSYINSLDNKTFVWLSLLLYVGFAAVNAFTHEVWFDEIQAWLIARDSTSIKGLFSNLTYEGHPPLWYLLLYILAKVIQHPAAMKLLHLLVATGTAYVFLRFAPFTRLQKLLFLFGYFLIYEYAAISRNYAIGVFLIFCFCASFQPGTGKKYFLLSIILSLLCQTNAYGWIITVSLLSFLIFEIYLDSKVRSLFFEKKLLIVFCFCLVLASLIFTAIVALSGSEIGLDEGWTTEFDPMRLKQTFGRVWRSFVPIPRLGKYSYWNTNLLPGKTMPALLAIPLVVFLMLLFAKKRVILFLFSFSYAGILTFQYLKHSGSLRHNGHFYILFIVCLWLFSFYQNDVKPKPNIMSKITDFCVKRKRAFLNVLLFTHLAVGFYASGMEWFCPFSSSRKIARYITSQGLDELPILGDSGFWSCPVGAHLNRLIYYPRQDRFGSFVILNEKELKDNLGNLAEDELVKKGNHLASDADSDVLFVLSYELGTDVNSLRPIEVFHLRTLWAEEDYYLYLLQVKNQ